MPNQTVIFTSDHAWNSPVQISAHHLARQFNAHGWRVLFLANPISPLHLLCSPANATTLRKFRSWRAGPQAGADGVASYSPLTLLPFSRVWPLNRSFTLAHWHQMTIPGLVPMLRHHGFGSPDLVVIDTAIQAALAEALAPRKIVYRITDANRYFDSSNRHSAAAERALAQRADLVVYTGRHLESYAADLTSGPKMFAPHGVDLDHFRAPLPPRPREYEILRGPIALFVGSLEDWVDVGLVVQSARQLPDVNFILIGPRGAALDRLEPVANLQWLGPRPYADIPAYMRHADIGLIPFDRARRPELVDAINPIKLYEYFASGLPVVACRTKEMAPLERLLHAYETPAQFVAQVKAAAQAGRHHKGLAFANELSWPSVYRKLVDAL